MFKFDGISQYCNNFEHFIGLFPSILCNFERFLGILGFWDLVRFWDFSKDFLGFLMKCTKIFRVIYPSAGGGGISPCSFFLSLASIPHYRCAAYLESHSYTFQHSTLVPKYVLSSMHKDAWYTYLWFIFFYFYSLYS
jgi:hypothetical protein